MKYIREFENVPLGFLSEMESKIQVFAKTYPEYECRIDEFEEDSASMGENFGSRVDIWLDFVKYGETKKYIVHEFRQKVFLIKVDDELQLMDCPQYHEYLKVQEMSA